ncbi:hypothetical protein Hypma_016152 [Hypsizygus marmoreus]|uniref:DUF6534 domain-containing protein n=1 Tax=Hypsizygus marmoreus TaxID=39966 RepID=A0A369J3L0_HYPMA|nr:hypothetical protein Hypma_016152 [Hypsizygus marmoreus]
MDALNIDVPKTFGALLLGGLFASLLTGMGIVQVFVYFRQYPNDVPRLKALVTFVWILDTCQTSFIWAALWEYFIDFYGHSEKADFVPWSISLTILSTAVLTFAVHCFYAHRIYLLSHKNLYLTVLILFLALARLASACATTVKTLDLHFFSAFKDSLWWLFTLGLALSSCVDVLITASLCFLLQSNRAGTTSLKLVIDSLIRYAFEAGILTCAGTFISMICWLTMRHNLIFLGVYFVVSKLYTNSLLVILNTRNQHRATRASHSSDRDFPILQLETRRKVLGQSHSMPIGSPITSRDYDGRGKVVIQIEQSIHHDVSDEQKARSDIN